MRKAHKDWITSGVSTIIFGGLLIAMGVITGFTIIPGIAIVGWGVVMVGIGIGGHLLRESIEDERNKAKKETPNPITDDGRSNAQRIFNQAPIPAPTQPLKDSPKQPLTDSEIKIEENSKLTSSPSSQLFFAQYKENAVEKKTKKDKSNAISEIGKTVETATWLDGISTLCSFILKI